MPSTDPRDYRTRGRWEGKAAPAWLRRLYERTGAPARYSWAAAGFGAVFGVVVGVIAGVDVIVSAFFGMGIAGAAVELWWARTKRPERGRVSDPDCSN
jgi:hypothetical protein